MPSDVDGKLHMNEDELAPADPVAESVGEAGSAGETPRRETEQAADSGGADPARELTLPQAELDEMRQKNVRLQAELENFRKRMMRTMDEERRYAALPLLRDLLPVVDNLQRAMTAAEQHENASGLLAGVAMVAEQLAAILQRHHCAPIAAEGTAFDPHLHEAIAQHPSAEYEPGHVCLVTQVGYQLYDRVVRPAQVIVAAPRETTQPTPAELHDPEI